VQRIERADAAAERIISRYAPSVCVIQGSYGFGKVRDGQWRFLREAPADLLKGMDIAADKVPLMLEGDGPIFRVEYTGTGFLVDGRGVVLTNRHIAEPWWKSEAAAPLLRDGYEARFLHLRAYFPGRRAPVAFALEKTLLAEDGDLGALFFDASREEALPGPIELAPPDALVPGRRVLLLGYPSGLDALLARTDEDLSGTPEGFEPLAVLDALAERDLVRPLPSQGHIGDVLPDRVVFDAPTAVGGSGGPLLDMSGRVVAINYGILKAFRGANFGVPVTKARALLVRAREALTTAK
jgi:S1-C subfamily serine protease